MTNARGIDCSHWQTATPSLAGLNFLIARATYATTPDDRYAQHMTAARKAGLIVGAYHFGVGAAQATIAAQAIAFVKTAGAADFLVLDFESNGTNGPTMTGLEAQSFIRVVRSSKRKVGLYHSLSGFPSFGQDFNWVADWGAKAPTIKWTFWQYTDTPVDGDYFNGDIAALRAFIGGVIGGGTTTTKIALENIAKTIKNVDVYLAIAKPTAKQKAALKTDLATLDADIAALGATTTTSAAPVTTGNPNLGPVPSGLTNYRAAELDAGFVLQDSLGNTSGDATNPAPGAAKELGFSGVTSNSQGVDTSYGVFKGGALVETTNVVPPTGWGFAFGLAAGFNNDDPYTGPGAVRP